MKTILVIGATGFIGEKLTEALVKGGHQVKGLYRSASKAQTLREKGVDMVQGDLLDPASLRAAMQGCDVVFHLAAHAKVWSKDPGIYWKINCEGTRNVLDAAAIAQVSRIVFTSTAGVFGYSDAGEITEETPYPNHYFTLYEETKAASEKIALQRAGEGQDIVILNPTRVYGPGLLSESNGVTRMVDMYVNGSYRFLPGDGSSIGNYVFVDDVVQGHLAAAEKGKPGERYLLGGENASFVEFFQTLKQVSGVSRSLVKLPLWLMMVFGQASVFSGKVFGTNPLITPGFVKKYTHNWSVSSEKAQKALNYSPTPLEEGLDKTLKWLNEASI